jgi:hypothetical protein
MTNIYDPRSLEYEYVCETIGHLYLERCHYERESSKMRSISEDFASKITSLNSEIDSIRDSVESDSAENEAASDVEDER